MTKQKFVEEYLMYGIILIMLAAQIIICYNTVAGQAMLLLANITFVYRDHVLQRPAPDRIKNVLFSLISGVCMGLGLIA